MRQNNLIVPGHCELCIMQNKLISLFQAIVQGQKGWDFLITWVQEIFLDNYTIDILVQLVNKRILDFVSEFIKLQFSLVQFLIYLVLPVFRGIRDSHIPRHKSRTAREWNKCSEKLTTNLFWRILSCFKASLEKLNS